MSKVPEVFRLLSPDNNSPDQENKSASDAHGRDGAPPYWTFVDDFDFSLSDPSPRRSRKRHIRLKQFSERRTLWRLSQRSPCRWYSSWGWLRFRESCRMRWSGWSAIHRLRIEGHPTKKLSPTDKKWFKQHVKSFKWNWLVVLMQNSAIHASVSMYYKYISCIVSWCIYHLAKSPLRVRFIVK